MCVRVRASLSLHSITPIIFPTENISKICASSDTATNLDLLLFKVATIIFLIYPLLVQCQRLVGLLFIEKVHIILLMCTAILVCALGCDTGTDESAHVFSPVRSLDQLGRLGVREGRFRGDPVPVFSAGSPL